MQHQPSVSDLLTLHTVADPAIVPGGGGVVVSVAHIENDDPPRYASALFHHRLDGSVRRLTRGARRDTSPRVSPDGANLAFLSDRDGGKPQLYLMPLDGGEATPLGSFAGGVRELAWHPSGEHLLVIARDTAEPPSQGAGRRVLQPYYRADGVGDLPSEPAALFRVARSGEITPLYRGPTSISDLHVGADGTLLFVAAHTLDDEGYYYRDVWRLDADATAARPLVAQGNPLIANAPALSPDRRRIAFLAPCDPVRISSPVGVWCMDAEGGVPELLTGEIDAVPLVGGDSRLGRYPYGPSWDGDTHLLFLANERGSAAVARVSLADRQIERLHAPGEAVTGFVAAGEGLAYLSERSDRPGELYWQRIDEIGRGQRLSCFNDTWVERFAPIAADPECRFATADGGAEIGYWTLTPRQPRPDGALVLQIHGGPRTTYGHGFSLEMQLLAHLGYRVVYGNPRGSAGYGYAFSESIAGRVGSIDADDVLQIAEHARAAHTPAGAPMHITGGSYGGFMTNWLIGVTDRFASAVTQRSISNWLSFYGTSDVGFSWLTIETGGVPWEAPDALWAKSPMRHVDRIRTPLLIIHAEQDHRCPIEQAEQFYVALRVLGQAPVEFLRFPDEGHDLSRSGRPDRRLQRLEAIIDWFVRYPGGPTDG
jgi:dipeptidyl aminopeptidase/acylaminoacyl peptidase